MSRLALVERILARHAAGVLWLSRIRELREKIECDMASDFWSMGCTLARAEMALVLSMTRAANGCAQATMRYGRSVGKQTLGSPETNQLDQLGLDPSSLDAYCAYLRELAGIARVSALTFVEVLERMQLAAGGPRPPGRPEGFRAGVGEAERAGRARRYPSRGAAAKDFLLY